MVVLGLGDKHTLSCTFPVRVPEVRGYSALPMTSLYRALNLS